MLSLFIPCALSRCEQVKWPHSPLTHHTVASPKIKVCNQFFPTAWQTQTQTRRQASPRLEQEQPPPLLPGAWQMAQQQHSPAAPGPKEQMLHYRTLSRALIFEEILDLTWLLLPSCHSQRQQKPRKTRLCRPLAQPEAMMSAGITTVWLIMAEIRVRVQSFRIRIFEDNYRGWKIGLRKILTAKIFWFLKMLPWKMLQSELVISDVETKNAESYLKDN